MVDKKNRTRPGAPSSGNNKQKLVIVDTPQEAEKKGCCK